MVVVMASNPDECPSCGSDAIVDREAIIQREDEINKPLWVIPDQSGGWRWYNAETDQIHFDDVGWIKAWDGANETKSRVLDVMDTLGYVITCPNCSSFYTEDELQ